jgi:DNA-binding XRE family transcriptional regulator
MSVKDSRLVGRGSDLTVTPPPGSEAEVARRRLELDQRRRGRPTNDKRRHQLADPPPLRELREASHLTQLELAERMHTTQAAVSRIEASPERLQLPTLAAYLDALGGSVELTLGDQRIALAITHTDTT